jgi:hypothetical protein
MTANETAKHEERKHALCSASGASRWLNCPGSVKMALSLPPPPTSVWAEEGTRAHTLAEKVLRDLLVSGMVLPVDYYERLHFEYEDTLDDGETMVSHVSRYVDTCTTWLGKFDKSPPPAAKPEIRMTLHEGMGMFGTADFIVTGIMDGIPTGLIVDLKYGKGIRVVAENNPQLAYYAVALQRTSKKNLERVIVVCVQPRIAPEDAAYGFADGVITTVSYSKAQLDFWYGVLTRGAEKALLQIVLPPLDLKAGEWCRFCPAKGACGEYKRHLEEEAALAFSDTVRLPKVPLLSVEDLGRIMTVAPDIEKFLDSVKEVALRLAIEEGVEVPGWRLASARTNRRWLLPESEVADHVRSFGVHDPYKPRVLKSPAAIEKELGGPKKCRGILDDLVVKPEGKPTLVRASDPGELFFDRLSIGSDFPVSTHDTDESNS